MFRGLCLQSASLPRVRAGVTACACLTARMHAALPLERTGRLGEKHAQRILPAWPWHIRAHVRSTLCQRAVATRVALCGTAAPARVALRQHVPRHSALGATAGTPAASRRNPICSCCRRRAPTAARSPAGRGWVQAPDTESAQRAVTRQGERERERESARFACLAALVARFQRRVGQTRVGACQRVGRTITPSSLMHTLRAAQSAPKPGKVIPPRTVPRRCTSLGAGVTLGAAPS